MVQLRMASEVTVPPNKLTKVHLKVHGGGADVSEVLLLGKDLSEGIKMDNVLVAI